VESHHVRRNQMDLDSPSERKDFSEDMILEIVKPLIWRERGILNNCSILPTSEDPRALKN